ncbi:hypothetical protein M426DRAFT_94591 [Hypoxylon sp. CI-4A]|nr:hypothetical protein M426DRAFT_94591 [Hypoxylon sp. CI-4A]
MEESTRAQARVSKLGKMNYACESCRMSKVKCQVGSQPGICKRCSEFKRECVFRTGPRTRRPKSHRPQTFSIDFTMPADEDLHEDFDVLREKHDKYLEDLVPSSEEDEADDPAFTSSSVGQSFSFNDLSIPTPSLTAESSTSTKSRPVSSLGIKPHFNLDSATKLLESFRVMLPYCPCIVLPDDTDVRSMAREKPFVLLAILAVTSCTTSLQGHSLYDEEFRKILGLKFVAGGERSLELLQGLLIYVTWYPFHLRPKNRQLVQYLRMAVDILHDLELDEDSDINVAVLSPEKKEAKLQDIRAYLACFYNTSIHAWEWSKPYALKYTAWTARCCDILEQHSNLGQDHILAWLARMQYIMNEIEELHRSYKRTAPSDQSEHQRTFIRIGLETQLRDFQTRIPAQISSTRKTSVLMASLSTDAYILAAPLMQTFRPRADMTGPLLDASKLQAATYTTRAFFDYVTGLPSDQIGYFCSVDLGRFILCVILAYRLSFPLPNSPAYDYVQGRKVLDFGNILTKLCATNENEDDVGNGGNAGMDRDKKEGASKKVDVASALRVVLGSLKTKFERKSTDLEAKIEETNKKARRCPMLDGSMDQYIPLWDGQQGNVDFTNPSYATSYLNAGSTAIPVDPLGSGVDNSQLPGASKPMLFHDLWATMTMGWAEDIGVDVNMSTQQEFDMANLGLEDAEEYVDLGNERRL